jgi:hypothetical protein
MRKSAMKQAIRKLDEGERLDPRLEQEADRDAVWAEELEAQIRQLVVSFMRIHPEGQDAVVPALLDAAAGFARLAMEMGAEDFADYARAVYRAGE